MTAPFKNLWTGKDDQWQPDGDVGTPGAGWYFVRQDRRVELYGQVPWHHPRDHGPYRMLIESSMATPYNTAADAAAGRRARIAAAPEYVREELASVLHVVRAACVFSDAASHIVIDPATIPGNGNADAGHKIYM